MMCEVPSNVIMADEFSEVFDGFSIGTNDLTQLVLGLDRDSEKVSHVFDERDPSVKRMVQWVIESAKKNGKKIGICGPAPSAANCGIYPFEQKREKGHEVVGYFFNPNIHPYQEYQKRLEALKQYSERTWLEVIYRDEYLLEEFLRNVSSQPDRRW